VTDASRFISCRASDLRDLLSHALEQYLAGGPPLQGQGNLPGPSGESHSLILAALQELPEFEHEEAFVEFLRENDLNCRAGLSALLRLVAASAQIALLSWLVDEQVDLEDGPYLTGPKTFDEAKDEATGLPWWSKP